MVKGRVRVRVRVRVEVRVRFKVRARVRVRVSVRVGVRVRVRVGVRESQPLTDGEDTIGKDQEGSRREATSGHPLRRDVHTRRYGLLHHTPCDVRHLNQRIVRYGTVQYSTVQ